MIVAIVYAITIVATLPVIDFAAPLIKILFSERIRHSTNSLQFLGSLLSALPISSSILDDFDFISFKISSTMFDSSVFSVEEYSSGELVWLLLSIPPPLPSISGVTRLCMGVGNVANAFFYWFV